MKVSDESTIVINDGAPVKTSVQTPVEKTKKKGTFWQGVLVGGIPGIMLGSAGTVFAARTPVQDEEAPAEEPKEEAVEANVDEGAATVQEADPTSEGAAIPEIEETVEVAENVNDDMSFSEAFATARAEVGPGGVFVWNGNVYSTYYEEEWDNMTDEQIEMLRNALALYKKAITLACNGDTYESNKFFDMVENLSESLGIDLHD